MSANRFESGQTDTFLLDAPDVGHIESITIGHDSAGNWAGWYLQVPGRMFDGMFDGMVNDVRL